MTLAIKRLHELSKAELLALGTFMREEIKPTSISEGSDWVCQKLQQGRWSQEQVEARATLDRISPTYRVWIAFEGKAIIGLCSVVVEPKALLITTFMVETAGRTEADQFAIADALALVSLAGLPEREEIYGWFPTLGFAARYAKRCGFTSAIGKPMAPDPDPIRCWQHDPRKLKETIEAL